MVPQTNLPFSTPRLLIPEGPGKGILPGHKSQCCRTAGAHVQPSKCPGVSFLGEWDSRLHWRAALCLMLLKIIKWEADFSLWLHVLKVFFFGLFHFEHNSPEVSQPGREARLFPMWAAGERPKRDGVILAPLSICTKGFCDPRQAAAPCPDSPPATYTVRLLIPSWSFKSGWWRPVEHLGERVPQDFCIMYQGESFNSREKNGTIWHQLQAS